MWRRDTEDSAARFKIGHFAPLGTGPVSVTVIAGTDRKPNSDIDTEPTPKVGSSEVNRSLTLFQSCKEGRIDDDMESSIVPDDH